MIKIFSAWTLARTITDMVTAQIAPEPAEPVRELAAGAAQRGNLEEIACATLESAGGKLKGEGQK